MHETAYYCQYVIVAIANKFIVSGTLHFLVFKELDFDYNNVTSCHLPLVIDQHDNPLGTQRPTSFATLFSRARRYSFY